MALHDDLINAGLPVLGQAVQGTTVLFTRALTLQETETYENIINPFGYKQSKASAIAAAIPNWATWTQQQWTDYFNQQLSDTEIDLVTSFAAARVAMKRQNLVILNMAKMIIAMRDYIRIIG